MSQNIELHIGGSCDDVAKRVANALRRAEAVSEDHLTFLGTLFRVP
jgi:hypothetical protein